MSIITRLFQVKEEEKSRNWIHQCYACQRKIDTGYFYPEDEVAFCASCINSTQCSCCHLPCGKKRWKLSDGRIICQHCHSTALLSPRQLLPMYETTIDFFRKKLKIKLDSHPPLRVVDRRFFKKLDCPETTLGVYYIDGGKEFIYILNGIAEEQSLVVLAHELTHYWQNLNCPSDQREELFEGFAVWTSYKLAEYKNHKRAMLSLRRNSVDPYHIGLRMMWYLEKKKGIRKLIKHAQTKLFI